MVGFVPSHSNCVQLSRQFQLFKAEFSGLLDGCEGTQQQPYSGYTFV